MSDPKLSTGVVGNDFIVPKRTRVKVLPAPVVIPEPLMAFAAASPVPVGPPVSRYSPPITPSRARLSVWQRSVNMLHDHSIVAFSLLVLMIAGSGIQVYGNYRAAGIIAQAKPFVTATVKAPSIAGLNSSMATDEVDAKLQAVFAQSATLTVGDKAQNLSPELMKTWLQLTPSASKTITGVHVNSAAIIKSVTELAQKYEKPAINQVTATYADGSSAVISPGRNGLKLTDPSTIKIQAEAMAKTFLDAKGFAFTTPLETLPFASVTPAAYDKLIEINVVSKQMYLYDKGQLTHSYPISAGAPATPTPIGQYKIFSKLPVQDMKGFNADGTKYMQPHVRWINYFLPGGYAIHGNYWRPLSWFGNINSSHGCASLPEAQAKEVYDWAPMGTTVITHR